MSKIEQKFLYNSSLSIYVYSDKTNKTECTPVPKLLKRHLSSSIAEERSGLPGNVAEPDKCKNSIMMQNLAP